MSLVNAPEKSPTRPIRIHIRQIMHWTLLVSFFVAMLGQPNGFFLYLPSYSLIALVVLLIFTLLMIAEKLSQARPKWPRCNLTVPLMAYLGLSLVSLSYSPDPTLGIRLLSSMLMKVVLFYALIQIDIHSKLLRKVLMIIMAMSVFFAVQALSQIVAVTVFHYPPSSDFSSRSSIGDSSLDFDVISYGIFGLSKQGFLFTNIYIPRCQAIFLEPGFYSNFIELALFASLAYFALYPATRPWKLQFVIGVQICALLMTFSPIGIIANLLGAGIYILFTWRDNFRAYLRAGVRLLQGALLCVCLIQLTLPELIPRIYQVVVISKFIADKDSISSGEDRLGLLTTGTNLFLQRPFLGWGTNQTRVVSQGKITNNALLTAGVELGIVGLCIYLVMLSSILWTIWANYRLSRHGSPQHRAFAAAAAACTIAMIFHSMFIDTQWTFYYWIALSLHYIARRSLMVSSYQSNRAARLHEQAAN